MDDLLRNTSGCFEVTLLVPSFSILILTNLKSFTDNKPDKNGYFNTNISTLKQGCE